MSAGAEARRWNPYIGDTSAMTPPVSALQPQEVHLVTDRAICAAPETRLFGTHASR